MILKVEQRGGSYNFKCPYRRMVNIGLLICSVNPPRGTNKADVMYITENKMLVEYLSTYGLNTLRFSPIPSIQTGKWKFYF